MYRQILFNFLHKTLAAYGYYSAPYVRVRSRAERFCWCIISNGMCCIGLRVLVVERQGTVSSTHLSKNRSGSEEEKKRTQISVCSQWVSGSYLSILHFHTFLRRASFSDANGAGGAVFFSRAREEVVKKYARSSVPLSTCAYFSVRSLYSINEPIQLKKSNIFLPFNK